MRQGDEPDTATGFTPDPWCVCCGKEKPPDVTDRAAAPLCSDRSRVILERYRGDSKAGKVLGPLPRVQRAKVVDYSAFIPAATIRARKSA